MTDTVIRELERILVGRSGLMYQLRTDIVRAGASQLPVLVQGPTGSGKELVARGLHLASGRGGPLVAFNVCAVPDSMFEDTLFGHVRGAFTGANSDVPGYLAEADRGTILLDEINGLALGAQAKLLRAIDTGVFRPVGARHDRQSNFRVIATSNTDLMAAVVAGAFRRDLFYRLSGHTIHVAPLSERLGDIPDLVRFFLDTVAQQIVDVPPDALAEFSCYAWPGNVRELRHAVARAAMLSESRPIDAATVRLAIMAPLGADAHQPRRVADARAELIGLLSEYRWDTLRVAERLGVHRATVYRRMQRYGLMGEPTDARER